MRKYNPIELLRETELARLIGQQESIEYIKARLEEIHDSDSSTDELLYNFIEELNGLLEVINTSVETRKEEKNQ